jgi:hypothetical protein
MGEMDSFSCTCSILRYSEASQLSGLEKPIVYGAASRNLPVIEI